MFENIKAIKSFDPAVRSTIEILLCYPGLHALFLHRIANFLYRIKIPLIPRLINTFSRFLTGIDIHPGAKIAKGVMIDHGMGLVIGQTAEIGKGCLIFQGVTLGGTGKEFGKRHPTLGENVVVGAGAKILGNIIISNNVRIGAGSVVLRNVPPDSTVTGIPGRVVKSKECFGEHGEKMLDHNELPDPVVKAIMDLNEQINSLKLEMEKIAGHNVTLNVSNPDLEYFYGDGI